MVLADLGRKITNALHSLSKATVINEDVSSIVVYFILSMFRQIKSQQISHNRNYERKIVNVIYF